VRFIKIFGPPLWLAAAWFCPLTAVSDVPLGPTITPLTTGAAQLPANVSQAANTSQPNSFRPALPGYTFSFPRDHGSHPEFQTEWWYFTGHLKSREGRRFGYQATWFRTAIVPDTGERESKWAVRDIIFAHLALTDEKTGEFFYDDRISRTALDMAGATVGDNKTLPRVWLDDWTLRFGGDKGERQSLRAVGTHDTTRFALALDLNSTKPPVIQGINGVSQKSAGAGRASHYYSFTRLDTSGTVRINGEEYSVTGESWFDHEFGSDQLTPEQVGWDWFSLQLEDGRELMFYQLRRQDGSIDPYSSGTLVERDGRSRHLTSTDFRIEPLATWRSPHSGGEYPSRWKVTLPGERIALQIEPTVADQELDTTRSTNVNYWEGSVRVSGAQNGQPLQGQGYVELTGYAGTLQGKF
jgi:predicted secreted hydrolase